MAPSLGIIVADFTTQLAADIIIGGTTGTLSSATDDDGVALASGHYFFTIDGGNSAKEHISCDLVGTALTNIKSVSRQGVETTGVVRKHRIGASISITDFAHISKINDVMRGVSSLDGASPLQYDVEPTFTDRKQLISKSYADDVLSGVVGTASDTTSGTTKGTKDQSTKPRMKSTLVREQNTPDMTLKVESFKAAFIDSNIVYAGGNSPSFINPGMGGDIAIPTANPGNNETITLTINGTACVFTFVTSIGSTPGNILIQGTAALTRAALATFINAPGTTNANQVAFTGAQLTAMGLVNCTDDLSSNIFVRATSATVTTFTMAETMAGSGNVVAVNTTKNRIDLLVLNGGALAIRKGTEAVSPTVPTPTTGDTVLVSVYNIPGETAIRDRSASLSGYISDWYDLAVYRTDIATTTTLSSLIKFGGTGSDGALTVSSGTTNIDCAGAGVVIKNYTSISITGTGKVTFTNPHANGTIIIFKSQGVVTLTSSQTPMLDGSALGAIGGTAVTASANTAGNAGTSGRTPFIVTGGGGAPTSASGSTGAAGSAASMSFNAVSYSGSYSKYIQVPVGSGGASGQVQSGGSSATSGVGGRGGGTLIIECAGAFNFTTASGISVAGANGGTATSTGGSGNAGGGGGGSGGYFLALYNTLTANTGTVTITGGTGGNCDNNNTLAARGGGGGGGLHAAGSAGTATNVNSAKTGGDGASGVSTVTANTDFA